MFKGIYSHRNRLRRRGRSHDSRLADLEAELIKPPERKRRPDPATEIREIESWASRLGGAVAQRAHAISEPYVDLLHEFIQVTIEAEKTGEITLGEESPRLFTGRWNLSPEHQARLDAASSRLDEMVRELRELRRSVELEQRQHAEQGKGR